MLANDSDPDGDLLSVDLVTDTCDGSVVLSGDLVLLTPDVTWSSPCTITYEAVDEPGARSSATVAVSVAICARIFIDGFETGDTSQWDSTEGGA